MTVCAWCGEQKGAGSTCGKCGADYAKAEMIKSSELNTGKPRRRRRKSNDSNPAGQLATPAQPIQAAAIASVEVSDTDRLVMVKDPAFERKLCLWVIPGMLVFALFVYVTGIFKFAQSIAFGMPVHEFGHAVVAWFCGYTAIPTLWKTIVPAAQGFIAPVILLSGIAYIGFNAWSNQNKIMLSACGGLLLLQVIGTFGVSDKTQDMLIVFGGEACGMLLATILMSSFYFGKSTQLYKGWLRWGFVFIGAMAFVDTFPPWWQAQSDVSQVKYGTTGGAFTDSYRLVNDHGWSFDELISRHVIVGVFCLFALTGVYGWGLREASQSSQEQERRSRVIKARARAELLR